MKVIVAGGRWIWDRKAVYAAIDDSWFDVTELVSGADRRRDSQGRQCSVDGFGEDWAFALAVPITPFPYRDDLGPAGGPVRNRAMARYAAPNGGLVLVWDGKSRGSANMKREAEAAGLQIFERIL